MARHLLQNYALQWAIAISLGFLSTRFLQNRLSFFREPNRLSYRTDLVFLLNRLGFFFIIKQGARPQPPIVSC